MGDGAAKKNDPSCAITHGHERPAMKSPLATKKYPEGTPNPYGLYIAFLLITFCPKCGQETSRTYADLDRENVEIGGRCKDCRTVQSVFLDSMGC